MALGGIEGGISGAIAGAAAGAVSVTAKTAALAAHLERVLNFHAFVAVKSLESIKQAKAMKWSPARAVGSLSYYTCRAFPCVTWLADEHRIGMQFR
jgi:hypothetical protein